MYTLYAKTVDHSRVSFRSVKNTQLFGCHVGLIPRSLRRIVPRDANEPYRWHLQIQQALAEDGYPDSAVVIDLKPKQQKKNVSLYELLDVWGISDQGWTPILLHLRGLFVDAKPEGIDRNDFSLDYREAEGPIYEFLHLDGSVHDGQLIGRWTAPPASPTNAALLWPDTIRHFVSCIRDQIPDIFK